MKAFLQKTIYHTYNHDTIYSMSIIIYTKTGCPWAIEAIDFLTQHNLPFEERDILTNPTWREEVEKATGQNKSPTLNIDGVWVLDAGVEDIAKALSIPLA